MITLDTNILYQTKYYLLNTKRTNTNAYQSIDAYSEAHATKGTPDSQIIDKEGLDLNTIIEALKLEDPNNRLVVLSLLDHADLVQLLNLLEKDQMLLGLKFFTKKKLLNYIYDLPKDQLLNILLQFYSKDELVAMLPMKALNIFLDSKKIEMNDLLKVFQSLPPHILAQIIEAATGEPVGKLSHKELMEQIKNTKKELLTEGIKCLPYKEMLNIVNMMTTENTELMKEMPHFALFETMLNWNKNTIIEGMGALKPELLINLLGILPNNLLAQVTTLIEPDKLVDALQRDHADILSALAA